MLEAIFARNPAEKLYVEDVFSTYLYTGTGATQTITNGIDLAGKGGMVWMKCRSGVNPNAIFDTNRGGNNLLFTDANAQIDVTGQGVTSFNTNGFTIGNNVNWNQSASTFGSWTFRKAPKFFDIVTWTGTGANRTISHSLGVAPGMILVKRTDTKGDWQVYHRSLANTEYLVLNTKAAKATGATCWNSTTATSTVFSLGTDATVNASGGTYVAYLFAHDTGIDGIVQCEEFTTNASGVASSVNLGWEPQFVITKSVDVTAAGTGASWRIVDNLRGFQTSVSSVSNLLAESSAVEDVSRNINITSTGFSIDSIGQLSSTKYIYLAIRRGPMRIPTDATKVLKPLTRTGTGSNAVISGIGFNPDIVVCKHRTSASYETMWYDRLRGNMTSLTSFEATAENSNGLGFSLSGTADGTASITQWNNVNALSGSFIDWYIKRAPGFFDIVCYTGTGSARTVSHNLGVAPQLMIVKKRNSASSSYWMVYSSALTSSNTLILNLSDATNTDGSVVWNSTTPTTSVFTVGTNLNVNNSGDTYVAYLFASCPGVSKVGSYTGNGSSLNIDCGFTNGARFILIKRTDSAGNWYVWDTARGIIAANDPHLSLNLMDVEVTTNDSIDPLSTGFTVNQDAATNINVNAANYIYLAIA